MSVKSRAHKHWIILSCAKYHIRSLVSLNNVVSGNQWVTEEPLDQNYTSVNDFAPK